MTVKCKMTVHCNMAQGILKSKSDPACVHENLTCVNQDPACVKGSMHGASHGAWHGASHGAWHGASHGACTEHSTDAPWMPRAMLRAV